MRISLVAIALTFVVGGCRDKSLDVKRAGLIRELGVAYDERVINDRICAKRDGPAPADPDEAIRVSQAEIACLDRAIALDKRTAALKAQIADIDSVQPPLEEQRAPEEPAASRAADRKIAEDALKQLGLGK